MNPICEPSSDPASHCASPVNSAEVESRNQWPQDAPRFKPHLIVMAGLPRSGKSTHARSTGHPVVAPDAIRLALHGQRFVSLAEPFVWAITETMVRALFGAGHGTVILDATNTTRERRQQWERPEWHTEFVDVVTPLSVCIARARRQGDEEIIPVIERMAANWEPFAPGQSMTQIINFLHTE